MKTLNSRTALILSYIIVVISTIILSLPVAVNWSRFTERFNLGVYERKYNASQYMVPNSKHPISDEELLSYAGYKYATGTNPVLINPDHPPLAKYIIGWITIVSGNNRVSSLVFALLNIIALTTLIYRLTRSPFLASLGYLMLATDSIFIDQIVYSPIMDIIQVFFLLLYFHCMLSWFRRTSLWPAVGAGLALGGIAASKLYLPAVVLLAVTAPVIYLRLRNLWKAAAIELSLLALAFSVYIASYTSFFLHGFGIRQFFGAQKWIFLFWKNNSVTSHNYFANVIPLVLFNRWRVWWGTEPYISFNHWTLLWPIMFLLGLTAALYFGYRLAKRSWAKKRLPDGIDGLNAPFVLLVSAWTILFLLYSLNIPISPRYLMMIYFPMYVLIPLFIHSLLTDHV